MSAQPPPTPFDKVNTQAQKDIRSRWPVWAKFLPVLNFQPTDPVLDSPLIDPELMKANLREKLPPDDYQKVAKQIDEDIALLGDDIKLLKVDLLRLFRERDHAAKKQQNLYRLYQISFLGLAAVATTLGSFQTLSLANNDRGALAIWAFLETFIALLAVYLATISGREPPLPLWMTNRRRAEQLRREYFRFLMKLTPYDQLDDIDRQIRLAERSADINRGVFPDESGLL